MTPSRSILPIIVLAGFAVLMLSAAAMAQTVRAVDSVGITVSDMDRALAFYRGALDFRPVSDVEMAGPEYEALTGVFGARIRVVRMALGDEAVELIQYLAPEGRPIPADSRSNDRWFQHVAIIVSDMDRAYARLRAAKARHASTGPQTLPDWNPNAGGIRAFYFKDPDGNPLEILQFPPGKGDSKWHRADDRLFLGIDHTAIVVADTDASLALYRDRLGLRVAGGAENYGTEQEHLNNVFGARLRITTLRAASGPGIELLEYLTPRDGRLAPADTRANDLWHEQVTLLTDDLTPADAARHRLVSPEIVVLPDRNLGLGRALMARDPDGHAFVLAQPSRQDHAHD
ncbi:VOC family protein [Azospirillum sp. TSH64]|uniref:VOC family protein n=1 Tax=Azospirillum sp. TSH64 TaxID=652740 RepID=UPI000D621F66|nr:VOC family protein [Azospirillum sp. TSH64]PWC74370.1 glyoxalase [Azospirillum sp. TSH64]